jgi:hypothetical protein
MNTANAQASATTTEVVAPASDAVSAALAALFGAHALGYQKFSTEVAAFHDRFVQAVAAGAASYATVEAASASPLQTAQQGLLDVINAPNGGQKFGTPGAHS